MTNMTGIILHTTVDGVKKEVLSTQTESHLRVKPSYVDEPEASNFDFLLLTTEGDCLAPLCCPKKP